jgi:hypothetical protein
MINYIYLSIQNLFLDSISNLVSYILSFFFTEPELLYD